MTPPLRPQVYSGMCICGHDAYKHHGSMVLNPEIAKVIGDRLPGACLAYGCNETEGLDPDGDVHCMRYVDAEDPEQLKDDLRFVLVAAEMIRGNWGDRCPEFFFGCDLCRVWAIWDKVQPKPKP